MKGLEKIKGEERMESNKRENEREEREEKRG